MAGIIQSAVKPVPLTPDPNTQQNQQTMAHPNTQDPTTATIPGPTPTVQATGYNPAQVASPTQWNVTDNQTVAGNVKSLIDQNSPIIQQARTNAAEAANERGLLNSAMAASAGEQAAYSAAVPIATSDAQTYSKAAGYNADQQNQVNLANANLTNQSAQFNAGAENEASRTGATLASQERQQQAQIAGNLEQTKTQIGGNVEIQKLQADTQTKLASMDAQNKTQLTQLQNQNQTLLQSNSQAAGLMNQATGVINNIMMNNQMDAAAKTEASRQVYENLRTQLSILSATSGLDLSTLLGSNPYPDAQTLKTQKGQQTIADSGLTPQQLQQMYAQLQQQKQQTAPIIGS